MSVTIAKGSSDVPQWATDRARQIVQPGENILGIYVVSDENRKNAVKQPMACFLAMPCFWPHALLMSPCLYAACQSGNKILKSTVYIITDKRLYNSVGAGELGFVCCTLFAARLEQADIASREGGALLLTPHPPPSMW